MAARAGVLFDLDGTLVDTNYAHVLAWWLAFADLGHAVDAASIHRSVGMGSDQLVPRLLGRDDGAAVAGHRRYYGPFLQHVRAFPRAGELLRHCARAGLTVVVATSAEPDEAAALMAALEVEEGLATLTSSADADTSKPAPDIFEAALQRTGLDPGRCVVVGDTVWDVAAAGRAGMDCVAVRSGGISAAELLAAGAVEVHDDAAALLAGFEDSRLARWVGGTDPAKSGRMRT